MDRKKKKKYGGGTKIIMKGMPSPSSSLAPSSFAAAAAPLKLLQQTIASTILQGPKFAVILCGNHQYKVSPGDVIAVQRLRAEIGSRLRLQKVLMVGGSRFTALGRPLLEGAVVTADVEEQKRMRNVVSLFATPGRRRVRWVDAPHAATILRIRRVVYQPEVLGEVDKYTGVLQPPAAFDPVTPLNPVYARNSGYHIFDKKSTPTVEAAGPVEGSMLGSMELMMMGLDNGDDGGVEEGGEEQEKNAAQEEGEKA